ncbi:hypothetical protein UF67_1177 [Staphylococcus aureus]|nr:hypothetical protein UF67_1177 [Staphylococcus aureus]
MMIFSKGNVDNFAKYQGAKLATVELFKNFHHIKNGTTS